MLQTTASALQQLDWQKTLDESGKKSLCSDLSQVMQQVGKRIEVLEA
jgi:hypothetical protein